MMSHLDSTWVFSVPQIDQIDLGSLPFSTVGSSNSKICQLEWHRALSSIDAQADSLWSWHALPPHLLALPWLSSLSDYSLFDMKGVRYKPVNVFSSSLLLFSLELSDIKVYSPWIRAHLGTAAHFLEEVVLKIEPYLDWLDCRTILHLTFWLRCTNPVCCTNSSFWGTKLRPQNRFYRPFSSRPSRFAVQY